MRGSSNDSRISGPRATSRGDGDGTDGCRDGAPQSRWLPAGPLHALVRRHPCVVERVQRSSEPGYLAIIVSP
jgi:hypothetical protein